jgi:enoyl-CoA hydratase
MFGISQRWSIWLSLDMSFSTLLYELGDDGIALVTFNRPDKLNALNRTVIAELDALLHQAAADENVRGLIVTGAGAKAFVAGADIAELSDVDRESGIELGQRGSRVLRQLEQLGKPVIAAVNGFALGGGCEVAMACHVRLASPNAKFGLPEVKLGLIPGFGGTVRLARLIGRGRALELLLTGNMIDAEEAARIGLVNRVVPTESLVNDSLTLLRTMLAQGPLAVRLCLQAVDGGLDRNVDDALALESTLFGEACASEDKNEGTRAFMEKRPAVFRGR